ncbi:MAG: glycosyltransferase [Verrucomicrobiota bacterium]|nr:glycosyltransferase [Verrucomicrobiota bacterium]
MKILAITDLYPTENEPRRGVFVEHSLDALSNLCEVRIIQPVKNEKNSEFRKKNIQIKRVSYKEPFIVREFTRAWKMKKHILLEVKKTSQDFDFDIVVGVFTVPGGWLAAKVAKIYNRPYAIVGLGSDIHLFHKHLILGKMTLRTLQKANMVIVNAENLKEKAITLNIPSKNIKVLPFGYDEKVFNINLLNFRKKALLILMVANLVEVKRPHTFINAAMIISHSGIDANFAIAGDGYMRDELEEKVRNSQFTDRFTFYGSISQKELAKLYSQATCTVLTSRSEGLPFCLIESLACGTPVVSTNLPGVREIVTDMENGILTNIDASEETAKAIKKVCSWNKSKNKIAESIKNRTWEDHAIQFKRLLEEVVKK